jgi:riboflavin synthase
MFTGLIETAAEIVERRVSSSAGALRVRTEKKLENLKYGESIAVNGACLTLEKDEGSQILLFHVLEETFKRTNLGNIPQGDKVNIERAMAMGDRFGGHIVSGHVDSVAKIISFAKMSSSDYELKVEAPESIRPFLVEKGSVAIDGISLTLVEVGKDFFTVHLIPVTIAETALSSRKSGDSVNLEADIIGKYVKRQLDLRSGGESKVDMDLLRKAGW